MLQKIIIGFLDMVSGLLNGLPTFSLDTGNIGAGIKGVSKIVAGANILVPVSDIFTIIGLVVAYRLFMFGVFIVTWVVRRIIDIIP